MSADGDKQRKLPNKANRLPVSQPGSILRAPAVGHLLKSSAGFAMELSCYAAGSVAIADQPRGGKSSH